MAVQTPTQQENYVLPISEHLQKLFGDDISMPERVDWRGKSNEFLESISRDGYVLSNRDVDSSG